jgi:hypothetical protein
VNREAELDRPSRVACSDLLGVIVFVTFCYCLPLDCCSMKLHLSAADYQLLNYEHSHASLE